MREKGLKPPLAGFGHEGHARGYTELMQSPAWTCIRSGVRAHVLRGVG